MKVHSRVRMPSPRLSSLTRRMTRKRRKKVMEMREFSSAFWNPSATGGGGQHGIGVGVGQAGPARSSAPLLGWGQVRVGSPL